MLDCVKLRAELDQTFLNHGDGKLYLGFYLDPLYAVHWNNQVDPLRFELALPEGIVVTPASGEGPRVEQSPADSDPREFLLDIRAQGVQEPIALTVYYFACDDAETFCAPVTQRYRIHLEQDPDGGSRRSAGNGCRALASGLGRVKEHPLMEALDSDHDGTLSSAEIAGAAAALAQLDHNGDGSLTPEELRGEPPPAADALSPPAAGSAPGDLAGRYLRYAVAIVTKYDLDHDGVLSKGEWSSMSRSPEEADADRDGQITLREYLDWVRR